jgi:nucleotidyltransferase substrate binding protein (TIGR01987 family)
MERFNERMTLTKKALAVFNEALASPYSKIVRDAAIQRFKFTLESLWKLAQRFLILNEGLEVGSPKGVVRSCFQADVLNEEQTNILLQAIDDRNLTVHTYNEQLAEHIYKNLALYQPIFNDWYHSIANKIKS